MRKKKAVEKETFTVTLAKDYRLRFDEDQEEDDPDTKTVYGTMEVEAASQEAAEDAVEEMMEWHPDKNGHGIETLQTVDPRIEWEEDCVELAEDGREYEDFTFRVVRDGDD